MSDLVLAVHVAADVVWIGAIVAVAIVLSSTAGDAPVRGKLGLSIYRSLAAPAFSVAFVAGAVRLAQNSSFYFQQTHFMHAKLTLALGVIALHHILGARAKRMASGQAADAGPARALGVVILGLAAAIVFLVEVKPF